MTIEEKAKAYDEAIERAKEYMDKGYYALMPELFPQLAESEDEKIRKELISIIDGYFPDKTSQQREVYLAWLEKQKKSETPQWMIDFLDTLRRYVVCNMERDEYREVEGKILSIIDWLKENSNISQKQEFIEKQKPVENNYPAYNPDEYESFEDGNATGLRKKQKPVDNMFSVEEAKTLDKHIDNMNKQKPIEGSENEKIRKEIMQYFCDMKDFCPPITDIEICDKWIAWLEKQKPMEFQTIEKALDDEWKKCEPKDEGMGLEMANIEHEQFDNIATYFYKLGLKNKQKSVERSEEYMLDNRIQYENCNAGIEAFAETYSFNIESKLFPQLTKEQQRLWREEIEQAVINGGEAGIELANDERYKKNEHISTKWSEEDYTRLFAAITLLEQPSLISDNREILEKTIDWLKSLKPQTSHESNEMIDQIKTQIALCNGFNRENRDKIFALLDSLRPKKQWKPSDEQLEKLHYAMCNFGGDVFKKLDSLYNDLKRLKGE